MKDLILKHYSCAVCNSENTKTLHVINRLNIVRCTSCSFVYVNPRIPNEHLYKIYERDYFSSKTENYGYQNYELTAHLRKKTFKKWIDLFQPYVSAKKTVLDIGCATGYFLGEMREHGWEIEGIELDKKTIEVLRTKNISVYTQPFETFNTPKKYSLITLFDVIEHIPDLKTAFQKLHDLLDDDGIIVLITPDHDSTQRKLFGKKWFQYKPHEHIQYFSPTTLAKAIEPHDLEIVFQTASGQYADTGFILNRLDKYNFKLLKSISVFLFGLFGLKNKYWYVDAGSMLAIIKKK